MPSRGGTSEARAAKLSRCTPERLGPFGLLKPSGETRCAWTMPVLHHLTKRLYIAVGSIFTRTWAEAVLFPADTKHAAFARPEPLRCGCGLLNPRPRKLSMFCKWFSYLLVVHPP